jgi:F-type H+-transporting ATPase subunit b
MELLTQLGVNYTLGIQLIAFLIVYVILKYVLFAPYFKAYNERSVRTVGQTELAERFINETKDLEEKFAAKATEVNERYKAVFDKTRSEAMKEYDRLVNESRAQSKRLIDETRAKIQKEMESARGQLKAEVEGVSKLINQKLIGKDVNA